MKQAWAQDDTGAKIVTKKVKASELRYHADDPNGYVDDELLYVPKPKSSAPIEKTPTLTPQEEIRQINKKAGARGDKYTITEEKRIAELQKQIDNTPPPTDNRTNPTDVKPTHQPGAYRDKELANKFNEDLSGQKVTVTLDGTTYTGKIRSNYGGTVNSTLQENNLTGKISTQTNYWNDGGSILLDLPDGTTQRLPTRHIDTMDILDADTPLTESELFDQIIKKGSGWGKKSTPVKTEGVAPKSAPKTQLAKDEVILYHRTSKANADELAKTGKMYSKENTGEVFLSNRPDEQILGYGDTVVPVKVKKSDIRLDDEFPSGEQHYAVKSDRATPIFDTPTAHQ
jgi:hypothetical protein